MLETGKKIGSVILKVVVTIVQKIFGMIGSILVYFGRSLSDNSKH